MKRTTHSMSQVLEMGLLAGLLSGCHTGQDQPKPNFLFLTCEDISPDLSFYGDSTAHTPNLDRLAGESLLFMHAYTTVGVCAPSRCSIITGMYPISIGTMHMRTAQDISGWGKRDYAGTRNAWDIEGNRVPLYSAVIPPEVKCFTQYLREAGYFCTNNPKTDYQFAAPVTAWDENGNKAHWKHRAPGQPFFAVFNDVVTHESRIWVNDTLEQTVNPLKVPLPEYFPDNQIVRTDVARDYSNIELLDQHIGERLKELEEAGLLNNTIIFFFSDHGGPLPYGKREYTENGLRVPFMIRFPDGRFKGKTDALFSFVDIAPTVLSLAGIPVPSYMQGHVFSDLGKGITPRKYAFGSADRFDEYTDRSRSVTDGRYWYVRNFYPSLPPYKDISYRKNIKLMLEWLRLRDLDSLNAKQSYWFRKTKEPEELYDTQQDPYCLDNRVADPGLQGKLEELRTALDDWLADVGDMARIPECEMIEQMWPGGIQPVTGQPSLTFLDGKCRFECRTEGASVAYLVRQRKIEPSLDSGWKPYTSALSLQPGDYLYALATRIGFRDSEIVVWKADSEGIPRPLEKE